MIDFERKPEVTADGSITLYIPEIDEHYHSVNGAIVEARHVYLKEALSQYIGLQKPKQVRILEVGFGTGLNAFLSLLLAEELGVPVHYTTLELYPLTVEQISLLNYAMQVDPARQEEYISLHKAKWNEPVGITPYFTIEKRQVDLTRDELQGMFEVVYFDAFAPDKQPEMWTDAIYRKIAEVVEENGILTTYCAKGVVRRGFRDAGFVMERIPGPPGKREMIRGTRVR
ncbi:MAG: tRNA (5-methylaminomethyl-2-thiouridine)(34)-methyltransferase MnmD [Bacteroidales bacterium]